MSRFGANDLIARARELHEANAFESALGTGSGNSKANLSAALREVRSRQRRACLLAAAVLAVVGLLSLLLPYDVFYVEGISVFAPADVADALGLWFRINVVPLFDPTQANRAAAALAEFASSHPNDCYDQVMLRCALTFTTTVCGVLLAVSGMLFQSAFRNPLAAPSMLGVADGVNIGYIVFCALGYATLFSNPQLFTVCVYGSGVATLLLVLFASRFIAGSKTYNVFDMLLIGTIVSQLIGGIVNYMTTFGMTPEVWENYYELQQAMDTVKEPITYAAVMVVAVVTLLPVVVLRFKLNLIAFSDDEARMLGARPTWLRGLALASGAGMQLAALASIGQVAMVSLAVPFLVRYMFGSDFRQQLLGNVLVGSTVLLVCQVVAHFAVFDGTPMPVGTVVSLVVMPFFVWMMALQKRGWE